MNASNPQLPLGISPRIGERFDTFFTGENALLVDVARATAETGAEQQLALWGVTRSGKSHLLNAICQAAADKNRTAVYLPLAEMIDRPSDSLQGLEMVDVIVIDDLDILEQSPEWQQALFNLINRVRAQQTSVVTASRANPSAMDLLPDLVSRLVWGPVLRVVTLGDNDLDRAISMRAQSLGLTLPDDVMSFLLQRYSRDIGDLLAALEQLDRASLVEQRRLTVPFVKSTLSL